MRSDTTTTQPLKQIGIKKDQSARAQKLADIAADEFRERVALAPSKAVTRFTLS